MNDSPAAVADQPFRTDVGLPFKTTDAILAQCLHSAGLKETALSPRNVYDADIVFRAGGGKKDGAGNVTSASRFAGMDIFDAAKQLHAAGVRGRVEYHFEHAGKLTTVFQDIYKDQVAKIDAGEGDAGEAILDIMRLAAGRLKEGEKVMDEREAVLRILCIALKLRIEFVNRWKEPATAVVEFREPGAAQSGPGSRPGSTRVRLPGGKFVPLYASKELIAKMEL